MFCYLNNNNNILFYNYFYVSLLISCITTRKYWTKIAKRIAKKFLYRFIMTSHTLVSICCRMIEIFQSCTEWFAVMFLFTKQLHHRFEPHIFGNHKNVPKPTFKSKNPSGCVSVFYKLYLCLISSSGIPPSCIDRFVAAVTADMADARNPLQKEKM